MDGGPTEEVQQQLQGDPNDPAYQAQLKSLADTKKRRRE